MSTYTFTMSYLHAHYVIPSNTICHHPRNFSHSNNWLLVLRIINKNIRAIFYSFYIILIPLIGAYQLHYQNNSHYVLLCSIAHTIPRYVWVEEEVQGWYRKFGRWWKVSDQFSTGLDTKIVPQSGIEPETLRSSVLRSPNWAITAVWHQVKIT